MLKYTTLAITGKKMELSNFDPFVDPTKYRSMVDALQYLTLT